MDTSGKGLFYDKRMPHPAHQLRHTGAEDPSSLLLELTREVTTTLDLQEVLNKTFAVLHRLIRFDGGAIQLIEDGYLVATATDPPMSADARTVRIPVGTGISGTIAATGEPIYIPDIWDDPRVHPEGKKKGVSTGVRSYFGVPLIRQGRPVGVMQIDSHIADAFGSQERSLVLAFVPTLTAAVQNATMFERERQALAQLAEAARMKRDFLAVVSHELRTPLTSVSGFGLTLARYAEQLDPVTIADFGQRIWRAGRRLERVMGDLLDLSNIERGILQVASEPTDIGALLSEAVREQTDEDHPMLVLVPDDLPKALTDEVRLHQILGNLLSNARKFSPAGSPIMSGARREGDAILISVEDRGRGIPVEMRDRVFEPFLQVEPAATRTAEGLGVGLYLVKQLCDRMGIAIGIEAVAGGGTRFTLTVPPASRAA